MHINMSTGTVSFVDKKEELSTVDSIFNAFLVSEDKDLTKKWLFGNQDNYSDFMNFLADLVIINLIILQGNTEVFKKGVIENETFLKKFHSLSPQIAKLMLVLIQSFKNNFKPKKYKHLDKKDVNIMFDEMISLLEQKIGYDFMFNKKIKISFVTEK